MRQIVWLSLPIVFENLLNMFVGLTDTFLAGHLKEQTAAATAAVGTITYVLWLISLIAGAIGTGSTAIIARAVGPASLAGEQRLRAIHRRGCPGRRYHGLDLCLLRSTAGGPHGAERRRRADALFYIKVLSLSLPFSMVMVAGASCLRGAAIRSAPPPP